MIHDQREGLLKTLKVGDKVVVRSRKKNPRTEYDRLGIIVKIESNGRMEVVEDGVPVPVDLFTAKGVGLFHGERLEQCSAEVEAALKRQRLLRGLRNAADEKLITTDQLERITAILREPSLDIAKEG